MNDLNAELIECEKLLRKVGEKFWADKLLKIIQSKKGGYDAQIANEIILLYGGMGSFNDLVISHHNGHLVLEKDEMELNKKLMEMRSSIYNHAMQLL